MIKNIFVPVLGDEEHHCTVHSSSNSYQGHPTTVFCKIIIPVRKRKYCLEFPFTWKRLKKLQITVFHS